MRRISRLNSSIKLCCGFLLFAASIAGVFWLANSSFASSNSRSIVRHSSLEILSLPQPRVSPTPRGCASCGGEGFQTIYAPLMDLPEASHTEINLNCRSPHVMQITPTFYTTAGEAFVGDTFEMQPTEVKTINLKKLMPPNIRNRHDWGGMSLSYTGGILEMWGQLRLMKVNRGDSVDITFAIQQDRRSDTRDAVWWMPKDAETVIAVGNFSDSTTKVVLNFSDGDSREVDVLAWGTQVIRKRSEDFAKQGVPNGAGVTILAPDSNGSIIAAGSVSTFDGSFTSSIRFYDTKNVAQPNLYATNFRLKDVNPRLLLRNTGTQTVSATPRFVPVSGSPDSFIDLPNLTLKPNEIAEVDIAPLIGAVAGKPEFDRVSVQVLNTGTAGSLIGALNGKDTAKKMTYDVPLRDIGAVRNSTGAYPWRLDHDLSTVVSITNVSSVQSAVIVQINYPGGPYLLDPRRLAAGETAVYDLRKIRDEQIPDRIGRTIPRSVQSGQFKWFIYGPGSGRLIGRAEMLSQSQGISSSYSCPGGNCPPEFSYAFLVPSDLYLSPGQSAQVQAFEIDCDAYGCYGPVSPYVQDWSNENSLVAVLFENGTTADLLGIGIVGGTTSFWANIGHDRWGWDGLNCYNLGFYIDNAQGQATVLKVEWNTAHSLNGQDVAVPIASGTPPQGSPAFVKTTTIIATGTPSGGSFSWSTSSNKITLSNTNSSTVTVTGVTASDSTRDVTITLTYTFEGHQISRQIPLTVQRPTSMDFVSTDATGTRSDCPSGQIGPFKDITWQLKDQLGNPIPYAIPTFDTINNNTPNSCFLPAQGEGTPPGPSTTGSGRWSHHYGLCSTACVNGGSCSVTGTQKFFSNGFEIDLSFTMSCSNITVAGH